MSSSLYHNSLINKLTHKDLEKLSDSWITPALAAQAGIFRVDKHEGAALVGRNGSGDYAGIVFPYHWPGEPRPREYRLRLDNPAFEYKADGARKEKNKYFSPPGGSNKLYIPPGTDPSYLTDTSIPILITEGEKKALALYRLGSETGRRWLVIGLSGVWNWRGTIGKEEGPDGERRDVKGPITDLDRIVWIRREVSIVFDADIDTNASVKAARRALAKEISRRRASSVQYVNLPASEILKGVDDLLAAHGPNLVIELFAKAQASEGDLTGFNKTDAGNAEAFAYLYGNRLRYDHKRARWLLWRNHYWTSDADGELKRMAIKASRELYAQAPTIQNLDEREKVARWSIMGEAKNKIEARLSLASIMRPIADAGENWDADPWLLGVANGVIDLRTGELRPGEPSDYLTRRASISYDPDAKCDLWLRFLDEIFSGDSELIDFINRAVGYSLTGITTEQVLFICHGKGANGKGVFLNLLRHILGTHAYNAPFSTFELDQRSAIPNDVAALEGRRLVVSSETNEGTRLNEARIKALTGCDPITARLLHKEFFTFDPAAKFWLALNHLPRVKDDSEGFWRRMRLIPFRRQFFGKDRDQNLETKLKSEGPGILALAVRNCLEWQKRGLEPPAIVIQATNEYRTDSDVLAAFLNECCIIHSDVRVKASDLFKTYDDWAERNSLRDREKLGRNAFGRRMGDRFEKQHDRSGWFYYGVGLRINDPKV